VGRLREACARRLRDCSKWGVCFSRTVVKTWYGPCRVSLCSEAGGYVAVSVSPWYVCYPHVRYFHPLIYSMRIKTSSNDTDADFADPRISPSSRNERSQHRKCNAAIFHDGRDNSRTKEEFSPTMQMSECTPKRRTLEQPTYSYFSLAYPRAYLVCTYTTHYSNILKLIYLLPGQ
jgi:hypothetical protein